MDIICKRCSDPIEASDINLDTNIAKCTSCNAVFDFRDQVNQKVVTSRTAIEAPKNIQLQSTINGLEIARKWFSRKIIGLLAFCVFWDGFMVVWFGIAISQQQWTMLAFGSLHALVGLGLSYYLVCGFINRTHVEIGINSISIRHEPLPWPGKKTVQVGDIKQVFTRSKLHRNKNSTSYTYQVHFLDRAGKDNKLLPGLEKPEQALYIEQEIEKTLGIKDAPVQGELARA